ncbi:MAG: cupin domain-containing protein [Nitrososphaerota archaeon]|jgi:hypothetical protein|nr:cupin domain-containing protein [Nitrososphaerota archaeon]
MPRKSLEYLDSESIPWTRIHEGVYERVLSRDPDTNAYTRLVRFDAGSRMDDILVHDFFEEFVVVDGSLTDHTLNKTFTRGAYAFRAPGLKHGPFSSPNGCLAIEIRYFGHTPKAP